MRNNFIINTMSKKIESICRKVYDFMLKKNPKLTKKIIMIDFVSPSKIKKLKKSIWNMDVYTDTITLLFDDSIQIYLCEKIIKKNASVNNNSFENELILVLIHSFLHGFGKNEEEVKKIQQHFYEEFLKIYE